MTTVADSRREGGTVEQKTHEQIVADVKADWSRPKDQETIRRRWPKLTCPLEIQTAEIKQRMFLQTLPTKFTS